MRAVFPKLRALDIRPYMHQGRDYLLLRDPSRLTDQTLLVPQPLALVLAFCDGTCDAAGMAAAFQQTYGVEAPVALVQELLDRLDEAIMLENERTVTTRQQVLADYRQAAHRPSALAGLSYPADSKALWHLLQTYLEGAEGIEPRPIDWSKPVGLLSPHIDYPRGGEVYAQVWKRAAQAAREADLVVIFGTDHYGVDPFTLTRQHYATPYGTLPTAQSLINDLSDVLGEEAAFAGELRHRGEHSLELVSVWLHHLRAGEPVEIAPILVGGLHQYLHNGKTPANDLQINQVVECIRSYAQGWRLLVVASGDMAHVGPAFGGTPLNSAGKATVRTADDELIDHMRRGDEAGFFRAIQRVRDRNNVCGVTPIYLTLRTLDDPQGEQVGYAVCPADEEGTSIVTICGMLFT